MEEKALYENIVRHLDHQQEVLQKIEIELIKINFELIRIGIKN